MIYRYYPHLKFFLLIFFGFFSSFNGVLLSFLVSNLVDIVTKREYSQISRIIIIFLVGLLIVYSSRLLFNLLKTDAVKFTNSYLRKKVFKGMLNGTLSENTESLSFLANDFKLLETNRYDAEISMLNNIFTVILSVGYGLYLNWLLTLIFLFSSFIPVIISNFFQKPIQRSAKNWSQINTKYVNQTKNFLEGADTFFLYQKQDQAVLRNSKMITILEESLKKMNLLTLNVATWIELIADIVTFLIPFLIGIYLIQKGFTTIGDLFGIIQLSNSFVNPILQILKDRSNLSTTRDIKKRISKYLQRADEKPLRQSKDFQELQVTNLNLRRQNQTLARNISFKIEKGEKVAVIGPSGVGKSTLLQFLMTGNYGEAEKVLLNGQLQKAGKFRNLFAYASQKAIIFSDNLWFNLTLGAEIDRAKVDEVCEKLDLSQIVKEKGYDYSLGDNADKLSGGQLSRIELARAILSERPIMLLDEINASLDNKTDQDIHRYLYQIDRTFIEVIHHYKNEDLSKYDHLINLGE